MTSLPSPYGVGDFGPGAFSFIDSLAEANQSYWQILPIGNTDDSGCPYATDSAFGCAEFFISPEMLIKEYGLDPLAFNHYFLSTKKVDFKQVRANKRKILEMVYKNFLPHRKFLRFLLNESDWIEDYCRYRTLCETRGSSWRNWGSAPLSIEELALVEFHKFSQYECFSQFAKLRKHAASKKIKLIGDLPIFVSYNSMDVWHDPHQFLLNNRLEMEYVTGAAPDAFSETGQSWGTPIYKWDVQKENNFLWWQDRLRFLKRYFDVVRIDHFRGFCATWISKITDPDARNGQWYPGPGADLFKALKETPEIIAEDLGYITKDVDSLRDQFNFPTMKVFQFMGGDASNPHNLPNYVYNSVAYSGTHDCNTLMGWFTELSALERKSVEEAINIAHPDQWDMIRVLMESPARIVLFQVQDLLGLGPEARFNYPGTVKDTNWTWKLTRDEQNQIDWAKLKSLTKSSGRSNHLIRK